jgi:teichuronic acid biosynthesis glycosyltransferase TuaC
MAGFDEPTMRVLIMTKIFPNRIEPSSSPFNRQQFAALGRLCDVEILATIPWFPGAGAFRRWSRAGRLLDVPSGDRIEGLAVHHPRFAFIPRIGHAISGPLYAASLAKFVLRYRGRVDVLLGSWAYPDGFAAVVLASLLGVPSVVKLHGSDIDVVARLPGPRRRLQWALPRAARVVAVSRPLADSAVALGVSPDRVDVVRNGVDSERFRPLDRGEARRALGESPDVRIVLCIGRIERDKGALDLIHAFARTRHRLAPRAKLVMVGDGSAVAECRKTAMELGADVEFTGPLPHDQIPRWIAACDVLALPSWHEGTPNVVLEAIACGRRVVATSVGGVPDVIHSDALGALVNPKDVPALATALQRSLSEAYDPASVAAAASVPDWRTSAQSLHQSLSRALECAPGMAA